MWFRIKFETWRFCLSTKFVTDISVLRYMQLINGGNFAPWTGGPTWVLKSLTFDWILVPTKVNFLLSVLNIGVWDLQLGRSCNLGTSSKVIPPPPSSETSTLTSWFPKLWSSTSPEIVINISIIIFLNIHKGTLWWWLRSTWWSWWTISGYDQHICDDGYDDLENEDGYDGSAIIKGYCIPSHLHTHHTAHIYHHHHHDHH